MGAINGSATQAKQPNPLRGVGRKSEGAVMRSIKSTTTTTTPNTQTAVNFVNAVKRVNPLYDEVINDSNLERA